MSCTLRLFLHGRSETGDLKSEDMEGVSEKLSVMIMDMETKMEKDVDLGQGIIHDEQVNGKFQVGKPTSGL